MSVDRLLELYAEFAKRANAEREAVCKAQEAVLIHAMNCGDVLHEAKETSAMAIG